MPDRQPHPDRSKTLRSLQREGFSLQEILNQAESCTHLPEAIYRDGPKQADNDIAGKN